jgi:hypothetical protein
VGRKGAFNLCLFHLVRYLLHFTPLSLCLLQGWNWRQEKELRDRKVLPSERKVLSGTMDHSHEISDFTGHRKIKKFIARIFFGSTWD